MIIAVDGFSKVGKSSISRETSKRMGFNFISSGNLYRAISFFLLNKGVNASNQEEIEESLKELSLNFINMKGVEVNGEYLESELRSQKIESYLVQIVQNHIVRSKVNSIIRDSVADLDFIIEGRDIGTQVFKNAILKFFFISQESEKEIAKQIEYSNYTSDKIGLLNKRDREDITRCKYPLRKAKDAVVVCTFDLEFNEIVNFIVQKANEVIQKPNSIKGKYWSGVGFLNINIVGTLTDNINCNNTDIVITECPTFENYKLLSNAKVVLFTKKLSYYDHETIIFMDHFVPFVHNVDVELHNYIGKKITVCNEKNESLIYEGERKLIFSNKGTSKKAAFTSTIKGMQYCKKQGASILATRGEFIYLQNSNKLPTHVVKDTNKKEKIFNGMKKIVEYGSANFDSVIYRFSDFSDDYCSVFENSGNSKFKQSNKRGIELLLDEYLDFFKFEIELINSLHKNKKNIYALIPYVASLNQAKEATETIRENFEGSIGCMIETPSVVYKSKELDEIFDFFIIGASDLLSLFQGTDRKNGNFFNDTFYFLGEYLDRYFLSQIDSQKNIFITSNSLYSLLKTKHQNLSLLNKIDYD